MAGMRGKPDLTNMSNHSVDAFLEGANADQAENKQSKRKVTPVVTVPKEQKIFRLDVDLIHALRQFAFDRTQEKGTRVTETEIVEAALRSYMDAAKLSR